MVTITETRTQEVSSFNLHPFFCEWFNTKLLSPRSNYEYNSISMETPKENPFIFISDINLVMKEVGKEHIGRSFQPIFRLKEDLVHGNSDSFLNLPFLTTITEKKIK